VQAGQPLDDQLVLFDRIRSFTSTVSASGGSPVSARIEASRAPRPAR